MGIVHWLEYPDPKPGYIVLYFSEGYLSAECGSIFEAFRLITYEYNQGNLSEKEVCRLLRDLKDFTYLIHEPFDFILIDLWLLTNGKKHLENFEFNMCNPCISCNILDRKKPHGYFSYELKSSNDGKKKIKEKIDFVIETKFEGLFVVKVFANLNLISDFTERIMNEIILDSDLPEGGVPPALPIPSLN